MVLRNVASLRTTGLMSVAEIVATHIDYTTTRRVMVILEERDAFGARADFRVFQFFVSIDELPEYYLILGRRRARRNIV